MLRSHSSYGSKDRSWNLPNITQVRKRSTEMLGNLPNVTELRYGRTERSGNLPNITQLKMEAQRFQATCLRSHSLKWKHRETGNLPKISQLRSSGTEQICNIPKMGAISEMTQ